MKWASGVQTCWFGISWSWPSFKKGADFRKHTGSGKASGEDGFVQWFNLQRLTFTSCFSGGAEASSNDVLQNAECCCLHCIFVRPQIVQRKTRSSDARAVLHQATFLHMGRCNSAHQVVERYKTAWDRLCLQHFIYMFHHPALFFLPPLSCVSHLKLLLFSLLTTLLSWTKKRSRITE